MAHFLIVEARFYDHLNDMLVAGAGEQHVVEMVVEARFDDEQVRHSQSSLPPMARSPTIDRP